MGHTHDLIKYSLLASIAYAMDILSKKRVSLMSWVSYCKFSLVPRLLWGLLQVMLIHIMLYSEI